MTDANNKTVVEDGCGNTWSRCQLPDCDLHVVRPGKVQCNNCDVSAMRAERDMLHQALGAFAQHVEYARRHGSGPAIVSLSSDAVRRLEQLIEFGMIPDITTGVASEVTNDSKTTGACNV